MDAEPREQITRQTGVIPYRIDARSTCASSRDRLFWCDFEFQAGRDDFVSPMQGFIKVSLAADPDRFQVLDKRWRRHARAPENWPCITGYVRRSQPLPNPVGFSAASDSAKSRWTADNFATQ
eukprot:12416234-Karenia_brevis.AAC.1